jgi:hypothetical protein
MNSLSSSGITFSTACCSNFQEFDEVWASQSVQFDAPAAGEPFDVTADWSPEGASPYCSAQNRQ